MQTGGMKSRTRLAEQILWHSSFPPLHVHPVPHSLSSMCVAPAAVLPPAFLGQIFAYLPSVLLLSLQTVMPVVLQGGPSTIAQMRGILHLRG